MVVPWLRFNRFTARSCPQMRTSTEVGYLEEEEQGPDAAGPGPGSGSGLLRLGGIRHVVLYHSSDGKPDAKCEDLHSHSFYPASPRQVGALCLEHSRESKAQPQRCPLTCSNIQQRPTNRLPLSTGAGRGVFALSLPALQRGVLVVLQPTAAAAKEVTPQLLERLWREAAAAAAAEGGGEAAGQGQEGEGRLAWEVCYERDVLDAGRALQRALLAYRWGGDRAEGY